MTYDVLRITYEIHLLLAKEKIAIGYLLLAISKKQKSRTKAKEKPTTLDSASARGITGGFCEVRGANSD